MNEILIILALSSFAYSDLKVEMTTEPILVYDMELTYPRPETRPETYPRVERVQFERRWGGYRSPYRTYYPGPGYRTPYYGIPRQGYWGARWQRDPYIQFHIWRGY